MERFWRTGKKYPVLQIVFIVDLIGKAVYASSSPLKQSARYNFLNLLSLSNFDLCHSNRSTVKTDPILSAETDVCETPEYSRWGILQRITPVFYSVSFSLGRSFHWQRSQRPLHAEIGLIQELMPRKTQLVERWMFFEPIKSERSCSSTQDPFKLDCQLIYCTISN